MIGQFHTILQELFGSRIGFSTWHFGRWGRQNVSSFCTPNADKLSRSEQFWRMRSAKYEPDCSENSIRTSKSQKTRGSVHFWKMKWSKFARDISEILISTPKSHKTGRIRELLEDEVGIMSSCPGVNNLGIMFTMLSPCHHHVIIMSSPCHHHVIHHNILSVHVWEQ